MIDGEEGESNKREMQMGNKYVETADKLQIKMQMFKYIFWPLQLAKIIKKNDNQHGHKLGKMFILINFYLECNL